MKSSSKGLYGCVYAYFYHPELVSGSHLNYYEQKTLKRVQGDNFVLG